MWFLEVLLWWNLQRWNNLAREPFSIKWNNIDSEFSSINLSELLGDSVQATIVPRIRCIKQMNTQANVSEK